MALDLNLKGFTIDREELNRPTQRATDRCIKIALPTIYHEVYEKPDGGWAMRAMATVRDVERPREIEIVVGNSSVEKPDAEAVLRNILTIVDHELREQLGLAPHSAEGARAEAVARFKRDGSRHADDLEKR